MAHRFRKPQRSCGCLKSLLLSKSTRNSNTRCKGLALHPGYGDTLQRREALEPDPFPPQRLGLHRREAPKPVPARLRVGATACALAAAPLVGAEAERSQQ